MRQNGSVGRRDMIKAATLGAVGAGLLARVDKVAAMQAPARETFTMLIKGKGAGPSERLLAPARYGGPDEPAAPATFDRLPLSWNKRVVVGLKAQLAERGIRAFLVRNPNSAAYLTGYWHVSTERPQAFFMNAEDEAPWYFYPAIDRDLVQTWWYGGGLAYFDYPHAEGGFPNEGAVRTGPTVDLFEFMLEGIKARGVEGNKIGIDGELYPSELAKARKVMPGIEFVNIASVIRDLRMVKTPEELALWSRTYAVCDRAHAFARDYIMTFGTDVTDREVAAAVDLWIHDEIFAGLDLGGGRPNYGVASFAVVKCRAGPVTAYAHPNQPYYNRIGRNMPIQVVIVPRIGGCGGEVYRMYVTADAAGRFDPHMERMWEANCVSIDIQTKKQVEGAVCADVARAVFDYQVAQGMTDYIYHRPAHGQNTEGHGPPYIALGDRTLLKRNIIMSAEPGLYDPKRGVGFNASDNVVTGVKSGYRMSRVPYTREWSFLKL